MCGVGVSRDLIRITYLVRWIQTTNIIQFASYPGEMVTGNLAWMFKPALQCSCLAYSWWSTHPWRQVGYGKVSILMIHIYFQVLLKSVWNSLDAKRYLAFSLKKKLNITNHWLNIVNSCKPSQTLSVKSFTLGSKLAYIGEFERPSVRSCLPWSTLYHHQGQQFHFSVRFTWVVSLFLYTTPQ